MMEYRVRDMTPAEYPLLADFLHMAIFVPPGQQPPPREVLASPEMQVYFKNFGPGAGDRGVVAEAAGQAGGGRLGQDHGGLRPRG